MTGRCRLAAGMRGEEGQMMVELAAVLPVAIIIAVIAVNAMTFFGECAEFDRVARNAVRMAAAAPAHGQAADAVAAEVEAVIEAALDAPNLDCTVSVSPLAGGLTTYTMTLEYAPTLFGMGLRTHVFDVALPRLTHESRLTVDAYKPGMLF